MNHDEEPVEQGEAPKLVVVSDQLPAGYVPLHSGAMPYERFRADDLAESLRNFADNGMEVMAAVLDHDIAAVMTIELGLQVPVRPLSINWPAHVYFLAVREHGKPSIHAEQVYYLKIAPARVAKG